MSEEGAAPFHPSMWTLERGVGWVALEIISVEEHGVGRCMLERRAIRGSQHLLVFSFPRGFVVLFLKGNMYTFALASMQADTDVRHLRRERKSLSCSSADTERVRLVFVATMLSLFKVGCVTSPCLSAYCVAGCTCCCWWWWWWRRRYVSW